MSIDVNVVIAALAFVSVFLLSFALLYLTSTRNKKIKARLLGLQGNEEALNGPPKSIREAGLRRFEILNPDPEKVSSIRLFLARAGYYDPQQVFDYYYIRLLSAVFLAVVALLVGPMLRFPFPGIALAAVGALLLGWVTPRLVVMRRIHNRREEIRRAVPNMLDLLVICVEAGLSLTAGIQRVASEMRITSTALSDELHIVTQEILIGKSKGEAFRNLADRTETEELQSLAVTINQSDRLGTSVAGALRTLADSMRFERRQRAEEQANKAQVRLVFPLVLLILPELLVVLLGPAMINIFTTLKGLAK